MTTPVLYDADMAYTADLHLYIISQKMKNLQLKNDVPAASELLNAIRDAYEDNRYECGKPKLAIVEGGDVVFDIVHESYMNLPVGLIEYRRGQLNVLFMICQANAETSIIFFSNLGEKPQRDNATYVGRRAAGNNLIQAIVDGFLTVYESMEGDIYMPLMHLKDPTLHHRMHLRLDPNKVDQCMDMLEAREEQLNNHTWFELDIPKHLQSQIGLTRARIYDEQHETDKSAGVAMRFYAVELYTFDTQTVKSNVVTYTCLNWQQVLCFLIQSGISENLSVAIKE